MLLNNNVHDEQTYLREGSVLSVIISSSVLLSTLSRFLIFDGSIEVDELSESLAISSVFS
jgi:hypothetical protein